MISFLRLRSDRISAQRHFVGFQRLIVLEQREGVCALVHNDAGGVNVGRKLVVGGSGVAWEICERDEQEQLRGGKIAAHFCEPAHTIRYADYSDTRHPRCYAGIMQVSVGRSNARVRVALLRAVISGGLLLASRSVFAQTTKSAPAETTRDAATQTWSVTANPEHLVNGAPVLFFVKPTAPLKSLTGTWIGHSITFAASADNSWFALAGISLETEPGSYPLELTGLAQGGQSVKFEQKFSVTAGTYETIELTVSKDFTAPSPEQMEIIKRDQEIKKKTFAEVTPDREWSGAFLPPVDAATSDVFGTRRVFNGVTKSVHQGLDYRVPAATPVSAVNAGTVILARLLYFEGNCVVIDHGQGLLTLYLHLSEFKVKEGDVIKRGQLIGLSGATGRATGPHLHIAVRWQGTYLNPAVLLGLPIPAR